jgi:hypothetical protein
MHNRLQRLLFRMSGIFFILVLALPGGTSQAAAQAASRAAVAAGSGPQVVWAVGPSLSQPLRSMPASASLQPQGVTILNPQNRSIVSHPQNAPVDSSFDPAIVQSSAIGAAMPAATSSFDGVGFNGYLPPDTEGAIGYDPLSGKKYYFQWVNVNFEIWDVTNPGAVTSVYGPVDRKSVV